MPPQPPGLSRPQDAERRGVLGAWPPATACCRQLGARDARSHLRKLRGSPSWPLGAFGTPGGPGFARWRVGVAACVLGLFACTTSTSSTPSSSTSVEAAPVQTAPPPRPGPTTAQPFHAEPTFELTPVSSSPRRSIVIVSLDTVSAPIMALYGGIADTPALARVAGEGVRFAEATTQFPETCLSHWTMLSGVLPEVHGNAPAHAGSVYTGPTLAEIAQKHGYDTGAIIGGVTLQDRACGLSRGFDTYDDAFDLDPADMKRPAGEVTERAVRWLEDHRDGDPVFLFVHYFDAHFPYTPKPPWDTRYDPDYTGTLDGSDAALRPLRDGEATPSAADVAHIRALYAGEVSELDQAIAPLLAAIPEDAVLVVTSDHGESFGHNYWFNHRGALWDDILRVPLLMRGLPGRGAGDVVQGPVGLVDVTPTVLSAAGLPHDAGMTGRDLTHVDPSENPAPQVATTDPWVGTRWASAHGGHVKALWRPDTAPVHFNLREDPGENSPQPGVPDDLDQARSQATARVSEASARQVSAPVRTLAPGEQERLEALGYVDPTKPRAKAPPRGKAPGQRRGPPGGATRPPR